MNYYTLNVGFESDKHSKAPFCVKPMNTPLVLYDLLLPLSNILSLSLLSETPGHAGWAETPRTDRGGDHPHETPTPGGKRRSRWDETPAGSQTPMTPRTPTVGSGTPMMTPSGKTPIGPKAMGMVTPSSTGW